MAPRTAMQVMAEQQQLIESEREARLATVAAQDKDMAALAKIARVQQEQIDRLTRGLQVISQMAGVEHKVAASMGLRFVQADVQNPAEPVPEPPAVPASPEGTVETKTPEAMADVQAPGLVPGSTNDVAADVTTTNYTPGQDIPAPAVKRLVDVTAPVDGTQTQRPLNETKTETDVRIGDPMNPQTAFPVGGSFAQQQRTSSVQTPEQVAAAASLRTFSSLRLARLRLRAGIATAPEGSVAADMELAGRIEKDAAISQNDIEREITTLDAVVKRQGANQQRNPRLVPKSAAARPVPSMVGEGSRAVAEDSDSDLFM